jgi:hypothetical protein
LYAWVHHILDVLLIEALPHPHGDVSGLWALKDCRFSLKIVI